MALCGESPSCPCHGGWIEGAAELFGGNPEFFEAFGAQFPDGAPGCDGLLGDPAGLVIADHGSEGGHHRKGILDQLITAFDLGLDAVHAFLAEDGADVGEEADALENALGHHRHHDIELEVAVGPAPGYGRVIAENTSGHHGDRLAHDRVDLAGHDR